MTYAPPRNRQITANIITRDGRTVPILTMHRDEEDFSPMVLISDPASGEPLELVSQQMLARLREPPELG